ncbi:hypothetical protein Agabi119p4_6307 [Agaricus bisporus var. burnettii]|uniref:G-patch domain-containing protein n=1 Tax=Agaricus bisporus var. burnettii TaxID=192524 RepID=A0A8H7F021_AGABI|nr:hypothetical protein Agabi119p4_6307 [Agaricus bisporus var. burnettii]
MSTRLKRKLNDLGVDVTSSRASESFCLIGTPLPPLEKSKDTGEFVPLWKQEVLDEKGRRRLHGAFTGGFSAGYFNTVGSKEGWTPATFVSSRADRTKAKASRPEDYMDEEDLQELRESRTLVDTVEEMDISGGTAAELKRRRNEDDTEQDSIVNTLQSTLLPPAADSAGARILRKMGWRVGSGIGPRVSLKQRRLQDLQTSSPYGTRAVIDDIKLTEDDEEASKHTYAPRDTPVLIIERKDNFHGLGYRSGMTLNESLGSSKADSGKDPRISAGFGLGALNDADEDDLDVYDADIWKVRNRLAYDAKHDDTLVLGNQGNSSRPQMRSTVGSTVFHDGSKVLSGFTLSEKPVVEERWFKMPDMPAGWQPDPRRVWEVNKENIPKREVIREPMAYSKWKSSGMTAGERGEMLGETPIQTGPRSVFDYLSEKDRERLKNITAANSAGVSPSALQSFSAPRTEAHVAQAALKGFQPFSSDPAKHDRYTTYLHSQANPDGTSPPLEPLPNQRPDDFQKELEDYSKAAIIFKPVSGAMGGRFQSAAHVEKGPVVREGLHQPTMEELEDSEAKRRKEEEEKLSPQAHAAKLGMYGAMTREVKVWLPARLLSKRFGVKEPDIPLDDLAGAATEKGPSFTTSEAEKSYREAAGLDSKTGSVDPNQAQSGSSGDGRNLANVGLGEDESQGRDTLTYERPAMDVFKAIFASDDEESDDEKEEDVPEPEVPASSKEVVNGSSGPSHSLLDDKPVDMTTFRPTFIPRENKVKKSKDEDEGKEKKGKKHKKDKKKKDKGPLVSFDVDEDGVEGLSLKVTSEERSKKRRKKDKKKREDDEDGSMWVEKPAPEITKNLPSLSAVNAAVDTQDTEVMVSGGLSPNGQDTGVRRARKRAIDFL